MTLSARAEVVLAEEDRPIGPVNPDQPIRGLLDVAEDGCRELIGEREVLVICSAMLPPITYLGETPRFVGELPVYPPAVEGE